MCPDRPLVGCCCIARAAAVAVSAAAQAQEALGTARAEVRGGIAWTAGEEEAVAGAAIGYDFDLGDSALIGVEGFADGSLGGVINNANLADGLAVVVGAGTGGGGSGSGGSGSGGSGSGGSAGGLFGDSSRAR